MPDPLCAQVMIVEDDALLALDVASAVRGAGLQVVGPFSSVDAAVRAVWVQQPDIAILDIDLRGQMSFPVADALAAANVPFVWLSGSSPEVLPSPHRSRPFASKPVAAVGILQLIAQMLKTP
jgi:DNA-binding NarL/FixJ family response regulator